MLHIITGSSPIGVLQNAANDLAPLGASVKIDPGSGSPPLLRADIYSALVLGLAEQNVVVIVATHDAATADIIMRGLGFEAMRKQFEAKADEPPAIDVEE